MPWCQAFFNDYFSNINNAMTNILNNCLAKSQALEIRQDKKLRPCCNFTGRGVDSLLDFQGYTDDEVQLACSKCISNETNGLPSRRHFYQSVLIDQDYSFFYDLQMSSLCNLQCRFCNPNYSTRLVPTYEFLKKHTNMAEEKYTNVTSKWNPDLEKYLVEEINQKTKTSRVILSVKGGEPTIQPEFPVFLDKLQHKENIRLKIITNLQELPEYLKTAVGQFHKTEIGVSLEGVEETYEYQRVLAKWDKFKNHVDELTYLKKHCDNLDVVFKPTISNHVIGDLDRLLGFLKSYDNQGWFRLKGGGLNSVVYSPNHLNPLHLPLSLKTDLLKIIPNEFNTVKSAIEKNPENLKYWHRFIKHTRLLDEYYGTDFFDTPTGRIFQSYM